LLPRTKFALHQTKASSSPHQADDHTSACNGWRFAAFLLLGSRHGERAGVAHVVPGGLDLAVGALDVHGAEVVDMAVEGIGDAAQPMMQTTTPVPVEGGVEGGALPKSAGTSPHGRRKPNGSACQRRTIAGVQAAAKHAIRAMSPWESGEGE
jgi:hypothetical protein